MNIFTQFFSKLSKNPEQRRKEILNELIRQESSISRDIFGPIPKGGVREFFCLDEHNWVWHEEWQTTEGRKTRVTRYIISNKNIVKTINNGHPQSVSLKEAHNLEKAAKIYLHRAKKHIYNKTNKS